MSRWFHVAYLADPLVQSTLDQMIFVLDPTVKLAAHVTLRGPFTTGRTASQNVSDLSDRKISIVGVGRFSPQQTTVFLQCDSIAIRERWWKPHYGGYNPHITIYDGHSHNISDAIFDILYRNRYYTTTLLGPVCVYESRSGQSDLSLSLSIDFENLSEICGRHLNFQSVRDLSPSERLLCFEMLAAHLQSAFNPIASEKWA